MMSLRNSALPVVSILGLTLCACKPVTQGPTPRIEYSIEKSKTGLYDTIHATVNGRTYPLVDEPEKLCLQIVDQKDFDANGSLDVLVSHVIGCGGNCCGNSYFFISFLGDGRFERSAEFGNSWSDPVIEESKGRWSVVVTSSNEGFN